MGLRSDLQIDPNEVEEPVFDPDWDSDDREAAKMEGVSAELVAEAKRAELRQLQARNTYTLADRSTLPADLKVVGTKWVLRNKGTADEPRVKARLCCQEFATYKDFDLFSGTPGLTAVKMILADLAFERKGRVIMLLDITGAFLYGEMRRLVAVRLPSEAGVGAQVVAVLNKSLYGLRDAPKIWQQHIAAVLKEAGFAESPTTVGAFRHKERCLILVAHVDDVMATGSLEDLMWLKATLEAEYDLKSSILSPAHEQTGTFLQRTIKWTKEGLT